MDLVKIGEFIADLRKEQGLTREQFGEKLGVTNKTISRWETGAYLPPAEALLAMSEIFHVNINEILSGRRLNEETYKDAAEENFNRLIQTSIFSHKEKVEYYKKKWIKEHIDVMICWAACAIGVFVAGIALSKPLLSSAAVLILAAGQIWRNNVMMAYVEKKVYEKI